MGNGSVGDNKPTDSLAAAGTDRTVVRATALTKNITNLNRSRQKLRLYILICVQERTRTMANQLTNGDIEKIKEEIEYRKLVVRKESIEAVKEARSHGDLSENFEYYAAKRDKNRNESRIRYLEKMIKTAQVISDESKEDEVGMNNTVTIYFEDEDETEQYKIVTSIRENVLKGLVSNQSPLGRAIMGHKKGDRVLVEPGSGAGYYVVIKDIDQTTDDSDDRIRGY